jgi:hypothetical protein
MARLIRKVRLNLVDAQVFDGRASKRARGQYFAPRVWRFPIQHWNSPTVARRNMSFLPIKREPGASVRLSVSLNKRAIFPPSKVKSSLLVNVLNFKVE